MSSDSFAHALSVDVEDWFQVLNMQRHVARSEWETMELRCGDSTRRLLDLFDHRGSKATFFCLGWIAERLPDLMADIASAGHEIGSHGYDHALLTDLDGADGFRADLLKTHTLLEETSGVAPRSFRACTWTVTERTRWAPEVLASLGYTLDSSVFPIRHPDYGVPGAPGTPYRIKTPAGEIFEFPPMTWEVRGKRIPVGGGGYLRLLPTWFLKRGLAQHQKLGVPGCVYLHPWEVDPEQPRVPLGGMRGFRHYVNLSKTMRKLDHLLERYRFVGLEAALSERESCLAKCPALELSELFG